MEKTFERVRDVPRLYKRQYRMAGGEWSTLYYARFVCRLKGKRRCFSLGSDLKTAKEELKVYEARNVRRENFDLDGEGEKAKGREMSVGEWLDRYLELVEHLPSWSTKKAQCAHLKRLLGPLPLKDVTRVRVMEYKARRLSEPLVRHGRPVKGTSVMGSTVNREVSCLVAALNLAAGEGLREDVPRIKKERETPRERTLTDAEYGALLDASPRWLQRVFVGANEAALDRGTLVALTWDEVQDGLVAVKGGRAKTGARQRVGIVPPLRDVLDELRGEFRRVPNTERRVFTRGGKPISRSGLRHAFEKAVKDAEIRDFQFRDFRHCARTRWAAAGLPFEIAETALGHKLRGMAGRYTNLSDDQVRDAFKKMATTWQHEKDGAEAANEKAS